MGLETNELASTMQQWQSLSMQAESGQLEIPEGVAFQCDEVCAAYIRHLKDMVVKTQNLVDVKAFGTLDSARQLGEKFERIAFSGDRSLHVVLMQHIEVIELMRSVFKRYFDEAEYADQRTLLSIGEIAEGLGE
ncbi:MULTISPECIES: hypothetical protein [unclassified Rhodococcus (in: high G+C Gram-positive bacteria)]|uniref:hypothetical protein n=1 Tax=unclassified Rhodococcus (in: high G+C Gram-positive bacteria) TaxID=192944 RepID=UPI0022B4B49E|nr:MULTISPECIES: hypothetical protein [unclassified Rhodococcus (in: high G+C Gram-positive bacteria)]MDI9923522.1 hypothetical protein [Rhodococcus sp. IEGM 1372]MDV8036012.1 hypothetical protein [Rhodococcus sp. IEGM 1414]